MQLIAEQRKELGASSINVADLAAATATTLGLSADDVACTRIAAQLHDIGKTAVPEAILSKPGPLDSEEWDFMRRHTLIGERIVAAAPALARIAPIVRASHERPDGNGYPDGLMTEAIPIGARIVAVVDAFSAMVSLATVQARDVDRRRPRGAPPLRGNASSTRPSSTRSHASSSSPCTYAAPPEPRSRLGQAWARRRLGPGARSR